MKVDLDMVSYVTVFLVLHFHGLKKNMSIFVLKLVSTNEKLF